MVARNAVDGRATIKTGNRPELYAPGSVTIGILLYYTNDTVAQDGT